VKNTRAQACAWRRRWQLVNIREREELRAMTGTEKLRRVGQLMLLARELGWDIRLKEEEEEVRERWIRIRKAYAERKQAR
jgi:hypothetical protein